MFYHSDHDQLQAKLHDAEQRAWEYSLLLNITTKTLEDIQKERDQLLVEREQFHEQQQKQLQQLEQLRELQQQQLQQQDKEESAPDTAVAETNTSPGKFCVSPSTAMRRVMDENAALRFANEILIQKVLLRG